MGKFIETLKDFGQKLTGKRPGGKEINDVLANITANYNIEVTDITKMTTEQLEALQCGGVVIKVTGNQKHRYVVSYKEDHVGICLTYADCENVETVSYDYTNKKWVYNSTDVTHIGQE